MVLLHTVVAAAATASLTGVTQMVVALAICKFVVVAVAAVHKITAAVGIDVAAAVGIGVVGTVEIFEIVGVDE